MSDVQAAGAHPLDVEDGVEVWRLLSSGSHYNKDTQRPTRAAFLRKRAKDPDGLSVGMKGLITLQDFRLTLNKTFGVGALMAEEVRSVPLECRKDDQAEVEARGWTYEPFHATIKGLPFVEDNPAEAERLASALEKLSRPLP